MKKILIITMTAAFCCINVALLAQDVVTLKNGSVIKGAIIEHVFGESVKIQTADGSMFVYKESEIDKVERGQAAPQKSPVLQTATPVRQTATPAVDNVVVSDPVPPATGWHFGVGFGYSVSFYNSKLSVPGEGSMDLDGVVSGIQPEAYIITTIDYRATELLDIESGLRFYTNGLKYEYDGEWMKFRQYYLTVPLTAKFYFGPTTKSFFVSTGFYLDFLVGASANLYDGTHGSGKVAKQFLNGTIPGMSIGFGILGMRLDLDLPFSNMWGEDVFREGMMQLTGYNGITLTTNRVGLRYSYTYTF
jgi:hypothetical protein